ncbi:hypothetical protein LCGC14_2130430 [marine sediment metagenome]|uniref:Uncharacterized protein n=1 Tax=marine sediment metagenome TaxID=412755 RepID=A0A0F9GXR9_9ZZZZ
MLWKKLPSGLLIPKGHKANTELAGRSRRGMQDALTMRGHLYIIKVHREDHVESIAEIYQGHIIPLRAFHMENLDE